MTKLPESNCMYYLYNYCGNCKRYISPEQMLDNRHDDKFYIYYISPPKVINNMCEMYKPS